MSEMINFDDFMKVDIRLGQVERVEAFPEARKPAWKMWINFGDEIGLKKTSAQVTEHYTQDDLKGRYVLAVVNFPPRQVGPFMSEVLTLGVYDADEKVKLIGIEGDAPLGTRLC